MKAKRAACKECPFRREAPPGWLGSNTPENFVANALTDASLACHTSMDQNLKGRAWKKAEAEAPRCFGALTLMRNEVKIPRDPAAAKVVAKIPRDPVKFFSNRAEFIAHHRAARIKSWEFSPDSYPDDDDEEIFDDD
jgi:hypothetical protein